MLSLLLSFGRHIKINANTYIRTYLCTKLMNTYSTYTVTVYTVHILYATQTQFHFAAVRFAWMPKLLNTLFSSSSFSETTRPLSLQRDIPMCAGLCGCIYLSIYLSIYLYPWCNKYIWPWDHSGRNSQFYFDSSSLSLICIQQRSYSANWLKNK